ncbi:MAG: alpha/beta hydrolase [Polymorphobacter sp.]
MTDIDDVRAMLQQFAEGPRLPDADMRLAYEQMGLAHPLPVGTEMQAVTLGGVAAEKIMPPGAAEDSALLYLHGGGYVIGSAASHRHLVAALAYAGGMTGYGLDYALAPEARFPAAVDDALAAYRDLLRSGIAAGRIIIAGDSAGGGLTLATALAIRAAELPQPAGLFVISPWADLTQSGETIETMAPVDLICSKAELDRMAGLYCGSDTRNPLASPLAGELDGLAPLLIHVGSDEILLSDALRLTERAGLARVPVRLMIAPHMPHVWHFFTSELSAARTAIAGAGAWMREHLVQER